MNVLATKKGVRNLIVFTVITWGGGFLGNFLNTQAPAADPLQSLGILIWLVAPLVSVLLLRGLGGDGWRDFGVSPHFRQGWRLYLAAFAAAFLIPAVVVLIGMLSGELMLDRSASGMGAFFGLAAAAAAGSLVKNIFEEFSWRGYLTPRLHALGASPLVNVLVTGVIWAGWHIPYYLFFLPAASLQTQTSYSSTQLIGLSFLILPLQSWAYYELRMLSGSVWPAWLLHLLSNAFSFALLTGGSLAFTSPAVQALITPSTEGALYTLLMLAFGWLLHRRRAKSPSLRA